MSLNYCESRKLFPINPCGWAKCSSCYGLWPHREAVLLCTGFSLLIIYCTSVSFGSNWNVMHLSAGFHSVCSFFTYTHGSLLVSKINKRTFYYSVLNFITISWVCNLERRIRVTVVAPIGNSDHSSLSAVISMDHTVPNLCVSRKIFLKHQANWNTVRGAIQDCHGLSNITKLLANLLAKPPVFLLLC